MALINSDLAVVRSTISLPTGTINAPPMPCRTRNVVSTGSVGASAQPIEARVKTAMATEKMPLAPNRSLNQPLPGISTATVSRYAVIATLICTAWTPRSSAIAGAAGAMMVASRFSMK